MFTRVRAGFSYANVMATIALFVALGGGAYAAFKLPGNSVGSKQLKANAVVSSKVKDGSLLASDFKTGQLPRGPQGLQGIQGIQGIQGNTGPPGPVDGTLPPGVTETGSFVARRNAAGNFDDADTAVSFPLRPPHDVSAWLVWPGGKPTPCTGSLSAPTAPPGDLCVYQGVNTNIQDVGFVDPTTTLGTNVHNSSTSGPVTVSAPLGLIIRAIPANSGEVYLYGTWAVTAP